MKNLLICMASLFFVSTAMAQKSTTIVVPFAAGGPNDAVARHLAHSMGKYLDQPTIVENRPSVGGIAGTKSVVQAAPNGSVLLSQTFTLATLPASNANLPFDPMKDLAFVGEFASMPMVLVVGPNFPANSVNDLVKHSREITLANSGIGSPSHLCGLLIADTLNLRIVQVPYKGNAPALVDLQSGQVNMICAQLSVVQPLIQSGRLKAIGVTSQQRLNQLPNVPSFTELGYSKIQLTMWHGLFAPRQTPAPILQNLIEALQRTVTDPEFQNKMSQLGGSAANRNHATSDHLRKNLEFEAKRWAPLITRYQQQ